MSEAVHPYCVVVAYDGRPFHGWQRLQEHPTVQAELEAAIERVFSERVMVQGAGRTDRGAHAEGQCAGFRLSREVPPDQIQAALNDALPEAVRIQETRSVSTDFHARTSAVGKLYEYRIANTPEIPASLVGRVWHVPKKLDVAAMERAVGALVGKQDYASFATKPKHRRKSTVCEVFDAGLRTDGDRITFYFHADSFLMHMVRNMVRALVKVGEGRYEPARIAEILEAKDRSASPGSAPASGLYLVRVFYDDDVMSAEAGVPSVGSVDVLISGSPTPSNPRSA